MISQNKNDLHSFVLDNNKKWNSIILMQDKNTIKCEISRRKTPGHEFVVEGAVLWVNCPLSELNQQ